jgi:hypothetical protein
MSCSSVACQKSPKAFWPRAMNRGSLSVQARLHLRLSKYPSIPDTHPSVWRRWAHTDGTRVSNKKPSLPHRVDTPNSVNTKLQKVTRNNTTATTMAASPLSRQIHGSSGVGARVTCSPALSVQTCRNSDETTRTLITLTTCTCMFWARAIDVLWVTHK